MGHTETVSEYHDRLSQAMAPRKGNRLNCAKIREMVTVKYPELSEKVVWIQPSDHCRNHTCKGACSCTLSERAIFDRLGRDEYVVL